MIGTFVVCKSMTGEFAALRLGRGLGLTSCSSYNFHDKELANIIKVFAALKRLF